MGTVNGLTSGESSDDDAIRAVRMPQGGIGSGYDFGEFRPASIGGTVLRGDTDAAALPYAAAELILEGIDAFGQPVKRTVRADSPAGSVSRICLRETTGCA